tara:strand:+ start:2363 stop:2590 length:228 start_codon:yes stop_codon:yes gene_type:complete
MAKCLQCGKEFTPKRKHKIFCSDSCRGAYHKQRNAKCEWCGQRKNQGTPYERMQNQDFLNAVWSKVQDKKLGELR